MGEKTLLVIFFYQNIEIEEISVVDISIAQEIQDSNNFSGYFQPRI